MIDRGSEVPVGRQAELLDLSRSSVYYMPRPLSERDLRLMRRLDELHLKWPFYGARKLTRELQKEGHAVGRRHVTTLMRRMGMETLYRKPRTSIPAREASIRPYLLTGLAINHPNQVWSADLTYLPMAHGFQYLVAILDVYSRKVLSWRVSNTMTPDFCVEALQEALERHGKPEIFNTDQGSQFTSGDWTGVLDEAQVHISMDGKGRWIDNVFIERLWRLCARYRYVADRARRSIRTADAHRMRAHNDDGLGAERQCRGRPKDDCSVRRARPLAASTTHEPAARNATNRPTSRAVTLPHAIRPDRCGARRRRVSRTAGGLRPSCAL